MTTKKTTKKRTKKKAPAKKKATTKKTSTKATTKTRTKKPATTKKSTTRRGRNTGKGKGRPTAWTKDTRDKIIAATRVGATREIAAQYAGVGKTVLYEWLAEGRMQLERTGKLSAEDQLYADFAEAVEKAESTAEVTALTKIQLAANKNWQAAAWYLERKHPQRYAKTTKIRFSAEDMSDEDLERLAAGDLSPLHQAGTGGA